MALFHGHYPTTIDSKNRLVIASDLRAQAVPVEDGENWVLVLGTNRRHLWMYPDLTFRKMSAMLPTLPFPDRTVDEVDMWFALARTVKPDAQGRVVLPESSKELVRLVASDVTLVGKRDHVEIWPTSEWKDYLQKQLATASSGEAFAAANQRYLIGGQ